MKSLLFSLTTVFLFAGCQESVFQSLKKGDELFVLEGLPHPVRENSSFEKEKKRNDVIQIEDHWFYDGKVKVSEEIHNPLMNLLFDESGFHMPDSNSPPKDCGPFHPDYAIMWNSDGTERLLMICYTCSEAKLIREGKTKSSDLNVYKIESWKNLLANFKTNRPR